jgi:hypothetical protein
MKGREKAEVISLVLSEFVLIYIGGQRYPYYSLMMNVFAVFGLVFIYRAFFVDFTVKIPEKAEKYCCLAAAFISVATAFYITPNKYLRGIDKDLLPQYEFAKLMDIEEDTTMLNYGFLDGGFYTVADILPNCRYFCKTNLNLPEMLEEQDRYVEEGLCDYIVARREIESDKYVLVKKSQSSPDDAYQHFDYYLYQLKKPS